MSADKPTFSGIGAVTPDQITDLISSTADLQSQVLRKFANAVMEEMAFHLYVAQKKCRMHEDTISKLEEQLAAARKP